MRDEYVVLSGSDHSVEIAQMTRRLFLGFLLVPISCLRLCIGAENSAPRATRTAAQLSDGLCKQYQILQGLLGLEVEYRMETEDLEPRSQQGWRWKWAEVTNIIKPTEPGKTYVQFRRPVSYFDDKGKVEEVKVETQIDSSDGKHIAHVEPALPGQKNPPIAAITSVPRGLDSNTRYRSFYFRFISYPVASDPDAGQPAREQYPMEDYWLPGSLANKSKAYRVRPELERVDGVWCHVLERPGLDVMWIQTDPIFLLRRRQFHWKEGGKIRQLATFRNHKEVSKGIWLPLELVFDRYGAPWEEADMQDRAVFRIRLKASRLAAEPVPDSRFRAEIPKGAIVHTEDNRRFINQPDGNPYELASKSLPPPRTAPKWLLLVSLLVLITILALLCWRISKNRAAERDSKRRKPNASLGS